MLYHINIMLWMSSVGVSHKERIDICAREWVEGSEKSGNVCTHNTWSGYLFSSSGKRWGPLVTSISICMSQNMSIIGPARCISDRVGRREEEVQKIRFLPLSKEPGSVKIY